MRPSGRRGESGVRGCQRSTRGLEIGVACVCVFVSLRGDERVEACAGGGKGQSEGGKGLIGVTLTRGERELVVERSFRCGQGCILCCQRNLK